MAAAAAGSVAEVVQRNTSKRGLAIIVTNSHLQEEKRSLPGAEKDGTRMEGVFGSLNIATLRRQNITANGLRRLLAEVRALQGLPPTYKSISFVYSGHGREGGMLCMEGMPLEKQLVHIQEIVDAFLPKNAPNIGNVPKLFFIDACRGAGTFQPVMVPRDAAVVERPQKASRITQRGATDLATVFVPPEGNTLLAYSNIQGQRALEDRNDGGVWMKALGKRMAVSKESIEAVLTEVREDLIKKYQEPLWRGHMQLPESVNRLITKVYLHPQAQPCEPVPLQAGNSSPPGNLTQRDREHPGYYRAKLLKLQQTGVIEITPEDYEGSFVCVLKFCKCSNGREYQFRSEKDFRTKAEAKESAAKRAVLSLEKEMRGVSVSPPQPKKPNGAIPRSLGGCVPQPPNTSSGKDAKSRLKEHCDKSSVPQPVYEPVKCEDANHQVRVKVLSRVFIGDLKTTKKEAEKSAAEKALKTLGI